MRELPLPLDKSADLSQLVSKTSYHYIVLPKKIVPKSDLFGDYEMTT